MTLRRFLTRPGNAFWSAWLLGLSAFVGLGVWCTQSYALPLDVRLTRWVQDLDRYSLADRAFFRADQFGAYGFIAGMLIGVAVLLALRGYRAESLVMLGAGAVHLVQLGVRQIVERPFSLEDPPWQAYPDWGLRQFPGPEGFPSGHVFGETIVYGLVILYAERLIPFRPAARVLQAACVTEILLGGPARMYTGAHFPSDVVGAMLLAGLYLAVAWRVDRAVTHIRAVMSERELAEEAGLSGVAARPIPLAASPGSDEREPAPTLISQ